MSFYVYVRSSSVLPYNYINKLVPRPAELIRTSDFTLGKDSFVWFETDFSQFSDYNFVDCAFEINSLLLSVIWLAN